MYTKYEYNDFAVQLQVLLEGRWKAKIIRESWTIGQARGRKVQCLDAPVLSCTTSLQLTPSNHDRRCATVLPF